MINETNRKTKKRFRRIIFNVETYPLAAIFLICTYFFLAAGRIDFVKSPGKISLPSAKGNGRILCWGHVNQIIITNNGKVFFSIDEGYDRKKIISQMAKFYDVSLSEKQIDFLDSQPYIGLDMTSVTDNINNDLGIPNSAPNNQLEKWIKASRIIWPECHFRIEADKELPLKTIKTVMDMLQDNGMKIVSLQTELELKEHVRVN